MIVYGNVSTHTALLLTAQLYNAQQLSSWCLHFISSNYVVYEGMDQISQLTGDNLSYIQEHRWPPLSYERAMEEYRKKYGAREEEEGEAGSTGGRKKNGLFGYFARAVASH